MLVNGLTKALDTKLFKEFQTMIEMQPQDDKVQVLKVQSYRIHCLFGLYLAEIILAPKLKLYI